MKFSHRKHAANLHPSRGQELNTTNPDKSVASLAGIVGQQSVVSSLQAFTKFWGEQEYAHGAIFLAGGEGSGKETLARCLANDLGAEFSAGDAIDQKSQGDLAATLTNLKRGQVFLLSNVHCLPRPMANRLGHVIRDGELEINIGVGPSARLHKMRVDPFVLIATAPRKADCPDQLSHEFSPVLELCPYSNQELAVLSGNIAAKYGAVLEPGVSEQIAKSCDGTPRHLEARVTQLVRALKKESISQEDLRLLFPALGLRMGQSEHMQEGRDMTSLTGVDFEKLIAGLLNRMGFSTEMTQTTGDGGIDIVAFLDKPLIGGRYIFQCKRFAEGNLVGAATMRDFFGAVTADRAVKGVFITTSGFTPQAREFGDKVGIELVDRNSLRKLLAEHQMLSA